MALLKIEKITKIFQDGTKALQDISFVVEKGDFVVIAGSNGSGKSVLMSIIASLEKATSGCVKINYKENDVSPYVGLVFQDADAQIMGETPEEDIAFGLKNLGYKKEQIQKITESVLHDTGLIDKKESPARFLSGGEKRRLSIAGILAMNADILIFDEPFANLDYVGIISVNHILQQLKQSGKTIIVLTHELEKVLALANRFLILNKGQITFDGLPQEGLKEDLSKWGIHNPLVSSCVLEDLLWI